ncbi:MAG TPA: hypothetical protein VH158_05215 [Gemmatimonadales bacterium]|nr:hypothetical protein [Gemmatimonadales bacterium]
MSPRRRVASLVLAALLVARCTPPADQKGKPANWTMIIGIDVSGSFRGQYEDAIEFASQYIYAHVNGLGGLRVPTGLFVGSIGGERPGEPKAFHPINDFTGRTPEQIAADLRGWFKSIDAFTDFNVFFAQVAQLVKERGLVLAPLNVVLLSDGIQDVGARLARGSNPIGQIDLSPLEFLSRSVTVRLLYASPTVGDSWKRLIRRKRVRLWTVLAPVMVGWHRQYRPGVPLERQADLWKWVQDNVDFRARGGML